MVASEFHLSSFHPADSRIKIFKTKGMSKRIKKPGNTVFIPPFRKLKPNILEKYKYSFDPGGSIALCYFIGVMKTQAWGIERR